MGRATQGVRLINLTKKNDTIASVCKVMSNQEEDVEEAEVIDEEITDGDAPLVDIVPEDNE
jgi:DNA gyrase subunit A